MQEEGGNVTLPSVIQSVAINPGNSGGALVDIEGRVIGIPTLAATDPQLGGGSAPGIGFRDPEQTRQGHRGPDSCPREGHRLPSRLPRRPGG